jgi:hypothetical protein
MSALDRGCALARRRARTRVGVGISAPRWPLYGPKVDQVWADGPLRDGQIVRNSGSPEHERPTGTPRGRRDHEKRQDEQVWTEQR